MTESILFIINLLISPASLSSSRPRDALRASACASHSRLRRPARLTSNLVGMYALVAYRGVWKEGSAHAGTRGHPSRPMASGRRLGLIQPRTHSLSRLGFNQRLQGLASAASSADSRRRWPAEHRLDAEELKEAREIRNHDRSGFLETDFPVMRSALTQQHLIMMATV